MMPEVLGGLAAQMAATTEFQSSSRTQAQEIDLLREELRQARETLEAIRTGAADALVVSRNGKEVVYTLENADKPFRIFLEQMQEGAVTVDQSGLVVYANRRFADFIGAPLESVMGSSFHDYVCTIRRGSTVFCAMKAATRRKSRCPCALTTN